MGSFTAEMPSLDRLVEGWFTLDKDEKTRKEITDLVHKNDVTELENRLRNRIAFGTAGLRSSMKAGFAHMNSVTVLQASKGLAHYVSDQLNAPGHAPAVGGHLSVVIGHDARYNSDKFARLAASEFLAKGFMVYWFEDLVHTPMVPFAVGHYAASVGVMVTASHNPKNDNGYKVYWSNGCQIIPPHDVGISKAIDAAAHEPLKWDDTAVDSSPKVKHIFEEASEAYFKSIQQLVAGTSATGSSPKFIYTAMHGVGSSPMIRTINALRLDEDDMEVVQAQATPDPEFPTVPFPNPEERGAIDFAKQEAEQFDCSFILANDPDADRFAAAEQLEPESWHQFTGNQMGVLLASFTFETYPGNRQKLAMLASTVSSRMLATIAKQEGFHFRETLTGFKWLGNVAQDLQQQGYDPAFAYEEAIGYMFPTVVWDKDGIAAAAVFLKACQHWAGQGMTPCQKLQQLYQQYGYFEDANTYLISPSPEITTRVFTDIRGLNNGSRPEKIGNKRIERWRDLTLGYDSATADNKPDLPVDSSAQMITCELPDIVLTARGSGTEPKIKLYIEARGASSHEARTNADDMLNALLKEWFKPEYGLRLAGT